MLRKWTVVAALVVIAVMAFSVAAFAQTEPGAGSDNPLTPDGAWTKMSVDGEHWYAFTEEGDGEKVFITMEMMPNAAVSFEVWTEENLQAWANEEDFEPVGEGTRSCGCERSDETGKFNWCGSFAGAGDFYVVVKSQYDDTSYYALEIEGKEVSFPLAVEEEAMVEETAAEVAEDAAPAMAEEPVTLDEP